MTEREVNLGARSPSPRSSYISFRTSANAEVDLNTYMRLYAVVPGSFVVGVNEDNDGRGDMDKLPDRGSNGEDLAFYDGEASGEVEQIDIVIGDPFVSLQRSTQRRRRLDQGRAERLDRESSERLEGQYILLEDSQEHLFKEEDDSDAVEEENDSGCDEDSECDTEDTATGSTDNMVEYEISNDDDNQIVAEHLFNQRMQELGATEAQIKDALALAKFLSPFFRFVEGEPRSEERRCECCKEDYTFEHSMKAAHRATCGHLTCGSCIWAWIWSAKKFTCPWCRWDLGKFKPLTERDLVIPSYEELQQRRRNWQARIDVVRMR